MNENFLKLWEWASKVLFGLAVFFLSGIYSDFKDIKVLMGQVVTNQALTAKDIEVMKARIVELEGKQKETEAIRIDFFKTYKLSKKTNEE